METTATRKLPTLMELVEDTEMSLRDNALTVILNEPPPASWLSDHPTVKGLKYLPIARVEYLLTRIYGKWSVKINEVKHVANSMVVLVTLTVRNPVTGEIEQQDGAGACPIQTDSGKGAVDWNFIKAAGVQIATPAAESYAIKDAAEKFGKIFGKDLGRKDAIGYDTLLKEKVEHDWEGLAELFELKMEGLSFEEQEGICKSIAIKDNKSYNKITIKLKSL